MVDYDLVIIGGTDAGRYAALTGASYRARVALVEPEGWTGERSRIDGEAIASLATRTQPEELDPIAAFENVRRETIARIDRQYCQHSLAVLAARGIDVIRGNGEFSTRGGLNLAVGNRRLRSRSYLIAAAPDRIVPDIEGLAATPYLTEWNVGKLFEGDRLPATLTAVGNTPAIVERVAALSQLGVQVTLVTGDDGLLAAEDPEAACWVRASLEAGGVRVIEAQPIVQVKQIQGQTWVQAGNNAIEADVLVLGTVGVAKGDRFNLEAIFSNRNDPQSTIQHRKSTDDCLRTAHPQIYAIGEWIGGYDLPELARYEAEIAVKNALFFPVFRVRYEHLPLLVTKVPALGRVGDSQARSRYRWGDGLAILKASFPPSEGSDLTPKGFAKLMLSPNGKIVGASATGHRAAETIRFLAFAKGRGLKIDAIASPYGMTSPIYRQLGEQWRSRHRSWIEPIWETWCEFRRDRR